MIFALLLLVVVPVLTSLIIAADQRQILNVARQAQIQIITLRSRLPAAPSKEALDQAKHEADAILATMDRDQGAVLSRVRMLQTIQVALTLTLGMLGLLACWLTRRALLQMRTHLAELNAERQKTAARNEQLAMLATITARMNSSLDLHTMLQVFLQETRMLIPFQRTRLALFPTARKEEGWVAEEQARSPDAEGESEGTPETERMRRLRGRSRHREEGRPQQAQGGAPVHTAFVDLWALQATGEMEMPTRVPLPQAGTLTWTLEHGRPLMQADTEAKQSGALMVVPLLVQGHVLGALQLESDLPDAFDETQRVLAQQIAGQLASAVQNARLYEEATHRADQLEWAMQETHHRIKNNLQAVASILDLYLMETDNAENIPAESLRHALQEIRTIAAVHDLLSEDVRFGRLNAQVLIETLVPMLVNGVGARKRQITTEIEADEVMIPSKIASAFALTIYELIANAIQHGGRDRDSVAIRLSLRHQEKRLCLTVADDGPGFSPASLAGEAAHIGLTLVRTLIVRDHAGTLQFQNVGGAKVTACIPFHAATRNSGQLTSVTETAVP